MLEWRCGLDASGSGYRLVIDSCEHGYEPSGSIKGGEEPSIKKKQMMEPVSIFEPRRMEG
jgi:hypothetical protein